MADKFREYLLGTKVIVYTDNNPLAHLTTAKLGATEQRWAAQLSQFDLEIRYRSGKSNRCADALSRCPTNLTDTDSLETIQENLNCYILPFELIKISETLPVAFPNCINNAEAIMPSYGAKSTLQREDAVLGEIHRLRILGWRPGDEIRVNKNGKLMTLLKHWEQIIEVSSVLYIEIKDTIFGMIKVILIPHSLQQVILEAVHDNWGHQGINRSYALLQTRCYWPGMKLDMQNHIKQCIKCTLAKTPTPKT